MDEIIFTLVFLVSRRQLRYIYYLEISNTVLQNYGITAIVNLRYFTYWVFHLSGKIECPRPRRSPKVKVNLKLTCNKFSLKPKNKIKCFQLL